MRTSADLLAALQSHVGRARGVTCARLAVELGISDRNVRALVTELRESGTVALCGHPRTGYYIAATQEEIDETVAFLRSRAIQSLFLASRIGRIPYADLVGQLRLPT